MENENIPQPLDTLMTQLGITNADLVNASTEQLSFKMVQKGRKGRRLTPNIQDKILTALLKVKTDLKIRRRDLFRYEPEATVVEQIQNAVSLVGKRDISYPQFIDLLEKAGVNRYAVQVGAGQIVFYGAAGVAHVEQSPAVISTPLGRYGETALRAAISDSQKGVIDHAAFLKRIHDAGIASYETNVRDRTIRYRGETQSYKEMIFHPNVELKLVVAAKPAKKKVKLIKVSNSIKARKAKKRLKSHRVKKRKPRK